MGAPLAAWLFACTGFLVASSWARLLVSGHPSPDLEALPFPLDLVGVTGFVAMVLACLRAHRGRVAQAAGEAAAWRELTREALVLAVLAGFMLPFLSGDLFSTLAYAELVVKPSVDPFTLPAPGLAGSSVLPFLSPRWREAPCVYGPLQPLFWSPAARFAASLPTALAVAKLLAVGAAVGTLALLRRYCSTPEGPGKAAFAAVALSPVLWVDGCCASARSPCSPTAASTALSRAPSTPSSPSCSSPAPACSASGRACGVSSRPSFPGVREAS